MFAGKTFLPSVEDARSQGGRLQRLRRAHLQHSVHHRRWDARGSFSILCTEPDDQALSSSSSAATDVASSTESSQPSTSRHRHVGDSQLNDPATSPNLLQAGHRKRDSSGVLKGDPFATMCADVSVAAQSVARMADTLVTLADTLKETAASMSKMADATTKCLEAFGNDPQQGGLYWHEDAACVYEDDDLEDEHAAKEGDKNVDTSDELIDI